MAGLVAACTQFLVHAAGEWVWHMPAVGSGFFLLVGALLGVSVGDGRPAGSAPLTPGREPGVADPSKRRDPSPLTLLAVAGAVLVALAAPQAVSERFTARGTSLLTQREPQLARQAAVWAARANPLSGKPYVLEAKAWAAEGDYTRAQSAFLEATEKNPADWHTYMIWGDTVGAGGGDPKMLYETARALNPHSFGIRDRLEIDPTIDPG